jgi:antirestriction protein ArdC
MSKQQDQFNYFTGHKYSGINADDLARSTFKSNQWATYGQWAEKEMQVQKGQHGTSVMFVKKDEETDKTVVKYYRVFNLEQVAPMETEVQA